MSYTKEEIKIEEQKLIARRRAARCVIALEGLSDDALDGGWNYKDSSAYVVNLESKVQSLEYQLKQLSSLHSATVNALADERSKS